MSEKERCVRWEHDASIGPHPSGQKLAVRSRCVSECAQGDLENTSKGASSG